MPLENAWKEINFKTPIFAMMRNWCLIRYSNKINSKNKSEKVVTLESHQELRLATDYNTHATTFY